MGRQEDPSADRWCSSWPAPSSLDWHWLWPSGLQEKKKTDKEQKSCKSERTASTRTNIYTSLVDKRHTSKDLTDYWTLLSDILVSSVKLVFSACPCCTWHVFINELLVFVLQLLPTLQICDVLDLLGCGSGSLQLLKDTLHMVPLLHVSCWLAERVRHHLPYPHYALLDFVLAFLTACSASFGVLHQEPLLCHVWLCGETLMEGRLGRSALDESVLIEYQRGVVECNSWKGSTQFQELLTPDRCSESL